MLADVQTPKHPPAECTLADRAGRRPATSEGPPTAPPNSIPQTPSLERTSYATVAAAHILAAPLSAAAKPDTWPGRPLSTRGVIGIGPMSQNSEHQIPDAAEVHSRVRIVQLPAK